MRLGSPTSANGKPSYLDMDEAFCARMRMAINAGLEMAKWVQGSVCTAAF